MAALSADPVWVGARYASIGFAGRLGAWAEKLVCDVVVATSLRKLFRADDSCISRTGLDGVWFFGSGRLCLHPRISTAAWPNSFGGGLYSDDVRSVFFHHLHQDFRPEAFLVI